MRDDCEICGVKDALCLDERHDGVDIVACKKCGLVWNRAMRDPQEQIAFYREENRAARLIYRPYLVSMLSRAACVLEFLGDDLKPGMRHLDVGCAEGTLLALTRAHGLEVTGLELDTNFSCFARETRGLQVFPMTLDAAPLAPNSFDVVSFVHVVEHLFHPAEVLRTAGQLVRDRGLIYVEVPNLRQSLPGLRRFFRHKHNFYFTSNTLRALICQAGLTPLRVGYSPRDASIQLLATKNGSGNEDFARHAPDACEPDARKWRDDATKYTLTSIATASDTFSCCVLSRARFKKNVSMPALCDATANCCRNWKPLGDQSRSSNNIRRAHDLTARPMSQAGIRFLVIQAKRLGDAGVGDFAFDNAEATRGSGVNARGFTPARYPCNRLAENCMWSLLRIVEIGGMFISAVW